MGESTFVNQTRAQTRPAQAARAVKNRRQGVDWILIAVTIALTLFGLVMVYSAGPKVAQLGNNPDDYYLKRQLLWAVISFIAAGILSYIPYRLYIRLTVPMMFVTLLSLVAVVILADTTFNANRSLLSGSIRPSELAKLVTIIYVSVWLYSKLDVLNDMSFGLVPLMLILGLTGGLILVQPDISAAITVIVLGGILFFLADGEWRQIGLVLAFTVLIGWIVVNIYPTGMSRIMNYISGLRDPMQASYHVKRSLEAIINGGLFGVGIGHGSTKFTGLPVAHTDSIFAVIAEETGLIGSAIVIAAYLVILWRGLSIASNAPDKLGSLLASGITVWITMEALLNIAVMVNLLPHAGNALPFISYGGSNLLITLSGIGILLNISRSSGEKDSYKGGGPFGAVVDLRWRDRRRRVSRFGRTPGAR